uniref:Uncharacterized protein n=1 Tax=Arundo donax TaxID=35708 RepID=A0A0A9H7X3_ARUDO
MLLGVLRRGRRLLMTNSIHLAEMLSLLACSQRSTSVNASPWMLMKRFLAMSSDKTWMMIMMPSEMS